MTMVAGGGIAGAQSKGKACPKSDPHTTPPPGCGKKQPQPPPPPPPPAETCANDDLTVIDQFKIVCLYQPPNGPKAQEEGECGEIILEGGGGAICVLPDLI